MALNVMKDWLDGFLRYLSYSRFIRNPKLIHYVCASCGIMSGLTFFIAFLAADFLPPMKPWWTPEQTSEHYDNHRNGLHACSSLMMFSGMFFLPYVAEISDQMRRIPNIPWVLPMLQLAAGAYSTIGFQLPGMQLAAAALRPDMSPELRRYATDQFWMYAVLPFSSFWPWSWSWVYAILLDDRERPLYPKFMALFNFFAPLSFMFSVAVHTTTTGPWAWNGALGFWIPLILFAIQYCGDCYYLFRAIHNDYYEPRDNCEEAVAKVELDHKLGQIE